MELDVRTMTSTRFETFLFLLVSSLAVMFLIWGLEAQPLVMVPVLLASMFGGGRGIKEPPRESFASIS